MTLEQRYYKALRKPSKKQMYASCYFVIYLFSNRGDLALCPTENVSMSSEIIRVSHLDYKWVVGTTSPLDAVDRHCPQNIVCEQQCLSVSKERANCMRI